MGERDKYIGENCSYYLKKWDGKKIFLSWNWSAFLFTYCWAMFRKMYLIAILFLVVDLFLPYYSVWSILLRVAWGLFANAIYMITTDRRIANKKGHLQGVNRAGAIVLYIASSIIVFWWPLVTAILKSI